MSIFRTFIRHLSPKRAVSDFADHWQQPTPRRWPILGVAAATTFAIFYTLIPADEAAAPERPKIDYVEFFEPGRTDEEIMASNIESQQRQDEIAAQEEERAERRRNMYRDLGRATGLDVDEMEREIEAEERAEEALEAAQRADRQRAAERAVLDGQ